jgi:hypothetical protein
MTSGVHSKLIPVYYLQRGHDRLLLKPDLLSILVHFFLSYDLHIWEGILNLPGSYFSVMDYEDGGNRCLRNFGTHPQGYSMSTQYKKICIFTAVSTYIPQHQFQVIIKVYVLLASDTLFHCWRDLHRLDDWEIRVQFPAGKTYLSCPLLRDQIQGSPDHLFNGNRGLFAEENKSAWVRKWPLPFSRGYTSTSPYVFMA